MKTPVLVLRADADDVVGAGHVSRCVALAQAWHDLGGRTFFVGSVSQQWLLDLLREERVKVLSATAERGSLADLEQLIAIGSELEATWIAVDGYAFDSDFLKRLAGSHQTLAIDDSDSGTPITAHLVVNPNPFGSEEFYRSGSSLVLAGPAFGMLRRVFAYGHRRELKMDALFVALGGDPSAEPSRRFVSVLRKSLADLIPDVISEVSVPKSDVHPVQQMQRSMVAIVAAGVTSLELCSLGVPQILVSKARNQRSMAVSLEAAGCGIDMGELTAVDPEGIATTVRTIAVRPDIAIELGAAGRKLIDGQGASRVALSMGIARVRLRPIEMSDAARVLVWANDAAVIEASFHRTTIGAREHENWLQIQLSTAGTLFLMAHDAADAAVGHIRFSGADSGRAEVHVTLDPEMRGAGLGREIIQIGCRVATKELGVGEFIARIRSRNDSSVSAFRSAGFTTAHSEGDQIVMTMHGAAQR